MLIVATLMIIKRVNRQNWINCNALRMMMKIILQVKKITTVLIQLKLGIPQHSGPKDCASQILKLIAI